MEPNRTYNDVEKSNETIAGSRDEKSCNLHIRACRKLDHRTIEPIDQRAKKSRGQLARMTVKKLDRIELEKWLNMIGITSEDVRLQTSMLSNLILRSSVESH